MDGHYTNSKLKSGMIIGSAMHTKKLLIGVVLAVCLLSNATWGADVIPRKPSDRDKCPVCGMFVAKYPDWVAEIIFKDGSLFFFDGAKDLFKFYFNLKKYAPEQTREDIAGIYVTEYYGMELIEARKAIFVIGSDVYGPMGRELIPLSNEADAREFMIDHKGQKTLSFGHVTTGIIQSLDE